MGTEADFYQYRKSLRHYERADPEEKEQYILSHYSVFMRIIGRFEDKMKFAIREESHFNLMRERGEISVRVDTSYCSNPTLSQAIRDHEIEDAFKAGDIRSILEDTDDPDRHAEDFRIIVSMESDYARVRKVLHHLKPEEEDLFTDYLTGKKSMENIAADYQIQYQSAKNKIARIRGKVIRDAAEDFSLRYAADRRDYLWKSRSSE